MQPFNDEPSEQSYTVMALWDAEARVWSAKSEDVPGLVAEDETLEGLIETVLELIPELLALNGAPSVQSFAPVHVVAQREERVRLNG